jgi:hypothetical protein
MDIKSPGRLTQKRRTSATTLLGRLLVAGAFGIANSAIAQDVITFGASLSLTGGQATEGRRGKEGYDL